MKLNPDELRGLYRLLSADNPASGVKDARSSYVAAKDHVEARAFHSLKEMGYAEPDAPDPECTVFKITQHGTDRLLDPEKIMVEEGLDRPPGE